MEFGAKVKQGQAVPTGRPVKVTIEYEDGNKVELAHEEMMVFSGHAQRTGEGETAAISGPIHLMQGAGLGFMFAVHHLIQSRVESLFQMPFGQVQQAFMLGMMDESDADLPTVGKPDVEEPKDGEVH